MQGGNWNVFQMVLSCYQLLCLRHRLVPAVPLGEACRQAVYTSHLVATLSILSTLSTLSSMRTKSTLSTTKAVHASELVTNATKGCLREIVRCSAHVVFFLEFF